MSYQVRVAGPAQRYVLRLPPAAQARILARIEQIAQDPFGPHAKRLINAAGLRSARVGGWRVIFAVDETQQVLDVVDIGRRGQIYRRL